MSSPRFISGVVPKGSRARLFALRNQALCVRREGDALTVPLGEVPAQGWLYLGSVGEEACYARRLGPEEAPPEGQELVGLRALFDALPEVDFGVACTAMALLDWDEGHRFCGRCGKPTERSAEDRSRVCAGCGQSHYPRLSPAVIVLVEHEGKALLARNRAAVRPFFSCLAGFVEVGETLEECVAREIEEEVGLRVQDVRYFGSQPWPFSNSLMIGFQARYAGGELRVDPKELSEAAWYAPGELPLLPGRISISRQLIDDFVRRHGGVVQPS